jgi:Flp pilus assembly protein TadD
METPQLDGDLLRARANARNLIAAHRYADAIRTIHLALGREPSDPTLWCLLAQAHVEARHRSEALEAAEKAVSVDPEREWPHRLLALAFDATDRVDEALSEANRAIALAPRTENVYVVLAQVSIHAGALDDAYSAAETAIALAPESPNGYNLAGLVLLKRSAPKEAEGRFRLALARQPDNSEALNNLGVALLRQGKVEAFDQFQAAARNSPLGLGSRNLSGELDQLATRSAVVGAFIPFLAWIGVLLVMQETVLRAVAFTLVYVELLVIIGFFKTRFRARRQYGALIDAYVQTNGRWTARGLRRGIMLTADAPRAIPLFFWRRLRDRSHP